MLRQIAEGTGVNASFRGTTAFNDDRVSGLLNEAVQLLTNAITESAPERVTVEDGGAWALGIETAAINGDGTVLDRPCQAILSIEDRSNIDDVVQHEQAASYSDFRKKARTFSGSTHTVSSRRIKRVYFVKGRHAHIFPLFSSTATQTFVYVPIPTAVTGPFGSGMAIVAYPDIPGEFHELVPRIAGLLAVTDDDRPATARASIVKDVAAQVERVLDRMHASRGRRVITRRRG